MGILDILKGAGQGQKQAPAIPMGGGYTKSDVKLAADMAKRMSEIEKLVKSSNKHWTKLGQARPLEKAQKSLRVFEQQQKSFDLAMKSGNMSMTQRIKKYDELSEARKDAIDDTKEYNKQLNEQKGMFGRLQNVLNEMPAGMSIFTAAIRDAGIVMDDMHQGFDIMAASGQVQNKTMGELAVSTGNYMAQMRMGSIAAATAGVTADESNAAFAKLTETFGGVGEKVDEMSDKWGNLATLAKVSGLGMAGVADMVDKSYRKLGETLEQTGNTIADIASITTDLNARFGEGSVNSKQFAAAIQEMAYGASFMNQNSRMLTETLGRELQMQLALGRAPEAAMKKAQQNMELASKVNIVGVIKFRDAMQKEYDALKDPKEKAAHLKKLADEFGSEGEVIANMLQSGSLMSEKSLFAFQKAVKGSAALGAEMLNGMRASAASGDVGALIQLGMGIDDAQYMVAEANLLATKIDALRKDDTGAAAKAMFGKNWQNDPEAKAFVEKAKRTGSEKMSNVALQEAFYKTGGAGKGAQARLAKEAGQGKKQDWEKYVDSNQGAGWFSGITNSLNTISSLLTTLPISLGTVLGALLLRKGLAGRLGNIGMPGSGGAGGGGRIAGMRQAMATGGGKLGSAARIGGGLALFAGLTYSATKIAEGMWNASEIMGKADVDGVERLAAGFGNLISAVTGGDARDAAMGNTWLHRKVFDMMGGDAAADWMGGASGVNLGESTTEELYAAHQKSRTDRGLASMSQEDYSRFQGQRKLRQQRIAEGETDLGQLTATDYINERTANSEVDANGDLILRVPGFTKDVAEANARNEGETS